MEKNNFRDKSNVRDNFGDNFRGLEQVWSERWEREGRGEGGEG